MKPEIIAYYLPQFHRTKENDEWWGTGFTEWTNVAKAQPLFKGHYQPKIPTELGFYDLKYPDVREKQAIMAKTAGLSAFCYWHYWFGNGKKLLNLPFDEVVKLGSPNFPFCLAWANHSWYKKLWQARKGYTEVPDGSKLLMEQTYPGIEDIDNHFYDLLGAFKDSRYYKIDGKLVFVIFAPQSMPDWTIFRDRWQYLAKLNDIPGFFFIGHVNNLLNYHIVNQMGFDAINLTTHQKAFPYANNYSSLFNKIMIIMRSKFAIKPKVIEYADAIELMKSSLFIENDVFPTIIPNWDHTPRSGNFGTCFNNCTPEIFGKHLDYIFEILSKKPKNRQIAFLKSWNEWGEGNYMEPDIKYGDGMLKVLKNRVEKY